MTYAEKRLEKAKRTTKILSYIVSFMLFLSVCIIVFAIYTAVNTPVVSFEYPRDRCVHVDDPKYSCDNLPTKYHHRWVEAK